jgi:hypothetical protein
MHWQDIALTVASLVFIVALLPTVVSRTSKPVLSTSVLNAAVSFGIAIVYATLHLWFAALTTGINGTLWMTIAMQTLLLHRAEAGGLPRKL